MKKTIYTIKDANGVHRISYPGEAGQGAEVKLLLCCLLMGCASEVTPGEPPSETRQETQSPPREPPRTQSGDEHGGPACGSYVALKLPDGGRQYVLVQCPDLSQPVPDPVSF